MTATTFSAYGAEALRRELGRVRVARNGERNNVLNSAAFNLGQLVAGGELNADDVERELTDVARDLGLDLKETRSTIKSGLSAGHKQPRTASQKQNPASAIFARATYEQPQAATDLVDPREYLHGRGLDDAVIARCGLRFEKGRVVIPWRDLNGSEVYWTSRGTIETDRYKNKPGARPPVYAPDGLAWESMTLFVFEGQIDAITAAMADFPAVALAGSTLTEEAVRWLSERDRLVFCFDRDEAGGKLRADVLHKLAGRVELFEVVLPGDANDLNDVARAARDEEPAQRVADVLNDVKPLRPDGLIEVHDFIAQVETERDDWLVPGFLYPEDRMILIGPEGAGKSLLLEQIGVQLASGLHPFTDDKIEPLRVLLIDGENSERDLRQRLRRLHDVAGEALSRDRLHVRARPEGFDLRGSDEDRTFFENACKTVRPHVLIAGPLYKLADGDPDEEQEMKPVATFFDRLRAEHGCAVLLEAHMPHTEHRPFGWSGWKRWPDLGFELTRTGVLHPWRAPRHEAPAIPVAMKKGTLDDWPFGPASRDRDFLWGRIAEHATKLPERPSVRELATALGKSVGMVQNTINEHRAEWEEMGR